MVEPNWKPTENKRELMKSIWIQIKGACEKLKEETRDSDNQIKKILFDVAHRYSSSEE